MVDLPIEQYSIWTVFSRKVLSFFFEKWPGVRKDATSTSNDFGEPSLAERQHHTSNVDRWFTQLTS